MKIEKKDIIKLIPLILLAMAIALSPSFHIGSLSDGKAIEIRLEDIFIAVLGFVWIAYLIFSGKKLDEFKKTPLFWPILILVGTGFLSTLVNLILGNIGGLRSFFYFLKEVEFFLFFFYVFYYLRNIKLAKIITGVWFVLLLLNVGYVFYQIIFPPLVGEYGTAAISEWGVFPTAAFFLLSFVFLINLYLYHFLKLDISIFKKGLLGGLVLSPAIGVFGTGSKAGLLALVFALILTIAFVFIRKTDLKMILPLILILAVISVIFFVGVMTVPRVKTMFYIFSPINMVKEFSRERLTPTYSVLKMAFEKSLPYLLFTLGFGKSSVTEAHNQYVRNFVETGIIGSLAFLILIWLILKKSFKGFMKSKDSFAVGLSAGLLTATLTMLFLSLSAEVFIVVKPSELYWFFAGITMAVLTINQKHDE